MKKTIDPESEMQYLSPETNPYREYYLQKGKSAKTVLVLFTIWAMVIAGGIVLKIIFG